MSVVDHRSSSTETAANPRQQREFGFLLRDIARLNTLNFERLTSATGGAIAALTLAQCRVLTYLQRNEGISKVRLAELTDTDPMTLGRLLMRMSAEGLVDQRVDPNDRRAHRLYLNPKALEVLEQIWAIADRSREEALAGLAEEERLQLLTLLRRIQGNLDAQMPGAAALATRRI